MDDVFSAVDSRPKRRQGVTGQTIEAQMRGTMCQISEYELDMLRDEITRLTTERDQALAAYESDQERSNEVHKANEELAEALHIALAQSAAREIAMRDRAALCAYHKPDDEPKSPYNRHGEPVSKDLEGFAGQVALHDAWQTAQDIRALPLSPDATSALNEMLADAWRGGYTNGYSDAAKGRGYDLANPYRP